MGARACGIGRGQTGSPGPTRGLGARILRICEARTKAYQPSLKPVSVVSGNFSSTRLLTSLPSSTPSIAMNSIITSMTNVTMVCRPGAANIDRISTSAIGMNRPTRLRRASTMSRTKARTGP